MANAVQLRTFPVLPPPPPKFSGRLLMRSPLTLMLCSALSVFIMGASALTVIDSVAAPTWSVMSRRLVCATWT